MMMDFEEKTAFYVFAEFPNRGWRLANGNLKTEPEAAAAADQLRIEGLKTRVTRCDTTVLSEG